MSSFEESAKKLDFQGLIVTSLITSFSLVVGLFWKDAVQDTIDTTLPSGEGLFYKYLVAFMVTIIVVVVSFLLIRSHDLSEKLIQESKLRKQAQELMKLKQSKLKKQVQEVLKNRDFKKHMKALAAMHKRRRR